MRQTPSTRTISWLSTVASRKLNDVRSRTRRTGKLRLHPVEHHFLFGTKHDGSGLSTRAQHG
jgi:hypothetical protein